MSDLLLLPETLFLWLLIVCARTELIQDNPCNNCTVLDNPADWSSLRSDHCCVKLDLSVDTMDWNIFTGLSSLRVLHLSSSGIFEITDVEGGRIPTHVEYLYMDHNHLRELPDGFLSNAPNLKVLHLNFNKLHHLPKNFLLVSNQIEEIDLSYNKLTSLPPSILKPSLSALGFVNNSLECTCALYDQLEPHFHNNDSRKLLEEVVCTLPRDDNGSKLRDLKRSSLCRSHSLTVVLICIPILVVLGIMCWYLCCRRQKGGYANTRQESSLVTVDRNGAGNVGDYHHYEPRQHFQKDRKAVEINQVNDPILLKPSAALLGSSRDLYEEVEIKLGTSADHLVEKDGQVNHESPGLMLAVEKEEDEVSKAGEDPEVETVSVTDVMKDSTDREKLYLSQATDYYSLVPEIELEDSDHCEYESVDLS
ncbi:leucine-rich repeat, immunoglobulin-like domain and transmembrane domain-containing 1 [Pelobates cultripes]|nr:leucine-rich repeat, immunoglobulin-like domain and transmembrane domain-containing 1 [Pelobates cultripes]